jgi:hypothetical protein
MRTRISAKQCSSDGLWRAFPAALAASDAGFSRVSLADHFFTSSVLALQTFPNWRSISWIADILDQAGELRAKRRQALAKLDLLTGSVFYDFFGDQRGLGLGLVRFDPRHPNAQHRLAIAESVCSLLAHPSGLYPGGGPQRLLFARSVSR